MLQEQLPPWPFMAGRLRNTVLECVQEGRAYQFILKYVQSKDTKRQNAWLSPSMESANDTGISGIWGFFLYQIILVLVCQFFQGHVVTCLLCNKGVCGVNEDVVVTHEATPKECRV